MHFLELKAQIHHVEDQIERVYLDPSFQQVS